MEDDELRGACEKHWGEETLAEALRLLQGGVPVLGDLLDGPIDVDKLDYVRRDAHHCGITFGSGLDVKRIVQSLTCVGDGEELGVRRDGVFAVEGFVVAQDQMLGSVYWHEWIRSVMAMFHEFLDALTSRAPQGLEVIAQGLKSATSELDALGTVLLPKVAELPEPLQRRLQPLFMLHQRPQFRDIYHAVAAYSHLDRVPPRFASRYSIYDSIVRRPRSSLSVVPVDWNAAQQLRGCFIEACRQKADLKMVGWFDVLVDVAWGKAANRLLQVRIDGQDRPITDLSHLRESIFTEPTAYVAPVRVFVSPGVYARASSQIESIRSSAEELFYTNQTPDLEALKAEALTVE